MVKESDYKQISIEEFKTPFRFGLDKSNRWVRLSEKIPWDKLIEIYTKTLRIDFGRPAKPTRLVVGAMIIKHKQCLSDEETVMAIQENPYLQYFIGYQEYTYKKPFDASLFVTIRKRLGKESFDAMNDEFIAIVTDIEKAESQQKKNSKNKKKNNDKDHQGQLFDQSSTSESGKTSEHSTDQTTKCESANLGKLLIDATVAPAEIKYPTNIELLNTCREHSERIIDILYEPAAGKIKPRTYRRKARRDYLSIVKSRKKQQKKNAKEFANSCVICNVT